MILPKKKQFFAGIVSDDPLNYNKNRICKKGAYFMEKKNLTEEERRTLLEALFDQVIEENLEALKELAK